MLGQSGPQHQSVGLGVCHKAALRGCKTPMDDAVPGYPFCDVPYVPACFIEGAGRRSSSCRSMDAGETGSSSWGRGVEDRGSSTVGPKLCP